jgi:xanthine dehydrogenase accessory factor
MVRDILSAVRSLVDEERLGADVTCVSGPMMGLRAVVDGTGTVIAGSIPPGVSSDVISDAVQLMENEQSRSLDYGDHRIFIHTIAPPPILVIFGASHVSQSLATFAMALGYRIIVVDARAAWATREQFPDVDELLVGWPDVFFADHELDARTYVALMNHDARFEDPVLSKVRDAPIRYLGAMGSRRTHRERVERLEAAGWTADELARIHGPIGLDIGAETPEEMAIAIVAEMTQVRYGHGSGSSLRGTSGRIRRHRDEDVSQGQAG